MAVTSQVHIRRHLTIPTNHLKKQWQVMTMQSWKLKLSKESPCAGTWGLAICPFENTQALAVLGVLPKKLLRAKVPKWSTYLREEMTKRVWRTKGRDDRRRLYPVTKPGEYILVDTMESRTPGFIAQLKGKLTKWRCKCEIVFKDHYSDLTYMNLHGCNNSESIVNTKKEFEAFSIKQGVRIK